MNYNRIQRISLSPPGVAIRLLVARKAKVSIPLPANVALERAKLPGAIGFYIAEIGALLGARRRGIDIVVTGRSAPSILAWACRRPGGYRWISDLADAPHKEVTTYYAAARTANERLRRDGSRLKNAVLRRILRRSDLVIISVLPESLAAYRIPEQKIRAFPNAILLDELERAEGDARRPDSICFVSSRFLADRGLDTLAAAVAALPISLRDSVRVTLAGAVSDELAESIRDTDASRQFDILGKIPIGAAHDVMRESEIGVLPYPVNEDLAYIFPIKLFEYMALGCVVVASDLPGVRKIVRHELDGLLVPPGDAEALAKALGRVFGDDSLRMRLRAAAYERVKLFDARTKVDSIFREIAQACAAPR